MNINNLNQMLLAARDKKNDIARSYVISPKMRVKYVSKGKKKAREGIKQTALFS